MFKLVYLNQELYVDCGYGILGINGSSKSTILATVSNHDIPIPPHIDIFHLSIEIPATDKTALEAVLDADQELIELEKEADKL
jgi:ATP-binding cassette subfamily F protein 2